METGNSNRQIGRSALKAFVAGASIIYATALTYCYVTGNYFAMGLMLGASVVFLSIALFTYKSL